MDLVDELRAFVATAQTGSFTGAADQLGVLEPANVEIRAELEARLGVRLFQRTTRKVGLTPAGEDLLARAPALLDDLDDLLTEVSEGSRGFSGVIRLSAPVTFGEIYVVGMLERFGQANPDLTFDLRLTDHFTDLASEGIDLAFRLGTSGMQSLKTRRLGQFQSSLVASPAYLAARGTPQTVKDLEDHACIVDTNRQSPRRWVFRRDGTEAMAQVQGRFHVNSARAAVELAQQGAGIAYVPDFALHCVAGSRDLVRLLADHTSDGHPITAAYLEGRTLPRKVRDLIDFAVKDIKASGVVEMALYLAHLNVPIKNARRTYQYEVRHFWATQTHQM